MRIKINTARSLLESTDLQVSTEAAAFLAIHLDQNGQEIARRVLQLINQENESRRVHGLPPRKRITAEDVKRALQA